MLRYATFLGFGRRCEQNGVPQKEWRRKEEDLVGKRKFPLRIKMVRKYVLKILAARFSGENINRDHRLGCWGILGTRPRQVLQAFCILRPLQKGDAVDCTVNLRHQPPLPPPTDLQASPLSFCDNAKRCSKNNDEYSLSQSRILLIG